MVSTVYLFNPQIKKTEVLRRCLRRGSFLLCFTAPLVHAVEADQDSLIEIKDEIDQLKNSYEDRIAKLEARLLEMEKKERADAQKIERVEKQVQATSAVAVHNTAKLKTVKEDLTESNAEMIKLELEDNEITRGFTFNGYFRSGIGTDDSGNSMEAFKAPNSQSKFRLGNEAETYVETAFGYTFPELDLPDGVEFSIGLRPSYSVPNANSAKSTFSWREAYAQAKGVWAGQKEASFWAGQRFYGRFDVHMTDFYYLDMSGFGGGVENIELGDIGDLSVAWLGGSIDKLDSNGSTELNGVSGKNSLDIRLSDLSVPGGKGMIWLDIADVKDSLKPNGSNVQIEGSAGAAIGFLHESEGFFGGTNRAMVQYGVGAAANFKATEPDYSGIAPPSDQDPLKIDYSDVKHFRFVNDLVVRPSDQWSMQATTVYDSFDTGVAQSGQVDWFSLGLRPVYYLNDYFSLALEAGVDHTRQKGGDSGEVYKITFAPQISAGKDHFSRPSLRLFVTYAAWSDEFIGKVSPQNYGGDSQGLNIGVQAEAWW